MDDIPQPKAWQPFTPRGVARFSHAKLGRLLLVELCVGLLVASTTIWFVATNFSPAITRALQQMAAEAGINRAQLTNASSGLLADGKFLSIAVVTEGGGENGTADIQVSLLPDGIDICSLLGCAWLSYPDEAIPLGRPVSEPWWGAWQPVVVAGVGVLNVALLLISWSVLALVYMPVAKLMAYFGDRELSVKGAWRLAAAAQLTAALYVAVALVLYGLQVFDLLQFLFFYAAHFLIAWVYVFVSPFFLPRITAPLRQNPFGQKG